jgi:hypothetical protein
MPFQVIMGTIVEYRCHGWHSADADVWSTPDKTEVTKSRLGNAKVEIPIYNPTSSEHKSLFKMVSDEFAGGQFSSIGQYTGINCSIGYSSADAYDDFPDLKDSYNTLAIEVIVKVTVYPDYNSRGFSVGIV